MKPLTVRPQARRELLEAVEYYSQQRAGLGTRFLGTATRGFDHIQEMPDTGFPSYGKTRTLALVEKRFPYGIVFKEYDDEIVIMAVYHLHRDEDYWYDRIENADQSS